MMKLRFKKALAAALAAISLLAGAAYAETDGNAVPAVIVEEPQDALRVWSGAGVKDATLLYLGAEIGIAPIGDKILPAVDGLLAKRDWDGLLAKGYPTPCAYPVQPSNFLTVARRAGLIGKVYWVPPTKKPVGEEDFGSFSAFLKGRGVSDGEIAALRRSDYSMEGVLNGIPFHICGIKDLPKLKGEVLLLADLSFFADTYENEVKTPFLDTFGGVVDILGGRVPKMAGAAVSCSTLSGPVPLGMRFAAGYLKTWLESPDRLKSGPPKQWELRSQAMYYDTFYQGEDSLDAYIEAVKLAPEDASLHFDLARALDKMKELDPLKDELDRAVELDPGYYPAYIEFAGTFLENKIPWAAEVCAKDAIKVNPADPRNYDKLYDVYDQAGMYDKAAGCVEKVIALGFVIAENYGLLGTAYTKAGQYAKAEEAYGKAISMVSRDDRNAMSSLHEGLADAYAGDKKVEKALDTYRQAMDYTDDPHAKMLILQKSEALRELWAPFMGGEQSQPEPSPPAPAP